MPIFGTHSLAALGTCDDRLQRIAHEAIKHVDFSVVEGFRGEVEQNKAVAAGKSKLPFPQGRHNQQPSRAFDFAPYPPDWSDKTTAIARFAFVAGVFKKCADDLGIKVRFGWDWNRNMDPRDESFLDWDHIELDEP